MSRIDVDAFMRQHRPRVIVYDFAPPYERNFRLFQHVRAMPAVEGCQFVLTSMNPANVADLVGRDERVYEVVDREEDLLEARAGGQRSLPRQAHSLTTGGCHDGQASPCIVRTPSTEAIEP